MACCHTNNVEAGIQGFDILLHHFFEKARWERALDSGVGKKLNYAILRELAKPETRIMIFRAIANNQYEISAPRSVLIPKDNKNEFREVYINDDIDRIFLSIANDLFFEYMPEMVHPSCKSYLKGIGCGRIVRSVSKYIASFHTDGVEAGVIGWKADLSKYFDTVPLHVIDSIFDRMEAKYGKSAIVRIVRKYYHCKEYKDKDGNPRKKYMSLRQGCAVSAFLANVVLFEVDKQLSTLDGYFVRYSDDMLYIGHDWQKAMEILKVELQKIGLQLNPRKFSPITDSQWFNFLGFSIKGGMVSLSPSQIKKFQKEITRRIRRKGLSYALAVKKVNKYLYVGNGEYCWANRVLPFINSEKDIQTLNNYVMDCLRSVKTGRHHLGGLGYDKCSNSGCIRRGTGRNVKHNREIVPKKLDGYITIGCMQKAMRYSNEVYEALVRQLNTQ